MELSRHGGANSGFQRRDFGSGDLHQMNSLKIMTNLRHCVAVQGALDLIRTRIQEPPTLGELALLTGFSRTYFSSVFKEVVGVGLQDYVIRARMNRAKDLLGDINLTIKKIAFQVGFRDPNFFSRSFKKETGMTPTTWRVRKAEGSFSIRIKRNQEDRLLALRLERRKTI